MTTLLTYARATLTLLVETICDTLRLCHAALVLLIGGLVGVGLVFVAIPWLTLTALDWISAHIRYIP